VLGGLHRVPAGGDHATAAERFDHAIELATDLGCIGPRQVGVIRPVDPDGMALGLHSPNGILAEFYPRANHEERRADACPRQDVENRTGRRARPVVKGERAARRRRPAPTPTDPSHREVYQSCEHRLRGSRHVTRRHAIWPGSCSYHQGQDCVTGQAVTTESTEDL
jgi:hypothetical protein